MPRTLRRFRHARRRDDLPRILIRRARPFTKIAPSCSYSYSYSYSVEYKSSEAPFFQVKVAYLSWFGIQSS
jgi:hypothetical protein